MDSALGLSPESCQTRLRRITVLRIPHLSRIHSHQNLPASGFPYTSSVSAVPRQPDSSEFGYLGLRMSADSFLTLESTRDRYELVHGVVCMSPRPSARHQRLLSILQFQLEHYVLQNPGSMYFPDVDLQLGADTVYAPDLVCYRAGRLSGIPARLTLPPDLVIEVLSPATKAFDLTTKRDDYEKFGVGEYWCYDPGDASQPPRLRCYRREGQVFLEASVSGTQCASVALPGFMLDLDKLRNSLA